MSAHAVVARILLKSGLALLLSVSDSPKRSTPLESRACTWHERRVAIPVRIPGRDDDRPPAVGIAAIAIAAIALGIGIARWGTYSEHRTGSGEAQAGTALPNGTEPPNASARARGAEPTSGGAPSAQPSGIEPTSSGAPSAPTETSAPLGPVADPAPAAIPEPFPRPIAGPDPVSDESGAREPGPALRIVRGRVAYLRCEGVPMRPGPAPCPRDEVLEARGWEAIDRLLECTAMPRTAGEADVVIDFLPGAIPEVRSRDTFGRGVVRLDAERVVACLAPSLASVPQSVGSSRLVVSFRFALVALDGRDPQP